MSLLKTIIILISIQSINAFSQHLNLKGQIGPYKIEMSLDKGEEENTLTGKYNYQGKKNYLTLQGNIMDDIIYLEEYYNGNQTGTFYLEKMDDSLVGKWIQETKWYDVHLVATKSDNNVLDYYTIEERSHHVSPEVKGTYETEYYFINDLWFEEDKPNLEVGYNGGEAVLEKISEDSLRFMVEVVCGPTYHFAYANGVAVRNPEADQEYIYDNEDGCHIEILLDVKEVRMSANSGMDCGFGARAYLDHIFFKTKDEASFEEER